MIKFALAAVAGLLATTAVADATVYVGTRALGPVASVDISVTTNGHIGTLVATDIVDWTVKLISNNPADNYTFTLVNSGITVAGTALSATASALQFNFDSPTAAYLEFYQSPFGTPEHLYCVEAQSSCSRKVTAGGEDIYDPNSSQSIFALDRAGIGVLGTAQSINSAVPEPASWALMLLGFGIAGAAMRRRMPEGQVAYS